jgi:tetratricopeptide (TPR) repeat protein
MIRSVQSDALAHHLRDASDARQFASSIIRARQQDHEFDARAVLDEFPELQSYGSAVLDLVYEEFSRRADAGEELDSQAFADRFPQFRSAVLEHIRAHRVLERCFGEKSTVWPDVGETVLGCELLEEIGRGAFSRVFLATQAALGGRRVVVKFCPSGAHEAHLLGKLEHEHIVQVHSVESDLHRRLNAIVMPFFGRATLRDLIDCCFVGGSAPRTAAPLIEAVRRINATEPETSRLAPGPCGSYIESVAQLLLDVARGLAHAHNKGVLHADIKPSNVLVTASLRARLLDFNLSHDPGVLTNMTGGTVPYMAPEQLLALVRQREPTPTVAADVHAFGATLFECLTGKSPYGDIPPGLDRTALAGWLLQRRHAGWNSLAAMAPHVPRPIRALVERCLSEDPRNRPAAIEEAAVVLERELRPPVRLLRRVQQRPIVAGVAAGLGAVALGAAMAWSLMADPAYIGYLNAGHQEYVNGNHARAVELFDLAEAGLPADAPAEVNTALWYERGRARLHRFTADQYDAAYDDFARVVQVNPGHAPAHASLGYSFVAPFNLDVQSRDNNGQYAKALEAFIRARKLGIDTLQLRYDIAICRFQLQQSRELGLAELQQLIREAGVPEDVLASTFRALIMSALAQQGDVDLPVQNMTELLARAGHSSRLFKLAGRAYLTRAEALSSNGNPDGAARHVDVALACWQLALQHGVPAAEIDALRQQYQHSRDDGRFARIRPAGAAIPSSGEPPTVLDPLPSGFGQVR